MVDRGRMRWVSFSGSSIWKNISLIERKAEKQGLKCNVCVRARGTHTECFWFPASLFPFLFSINSAVLRNRVSVVPTVKRLLEDDIKALTALGTAGASQRERVVLHRSFRVVSLCPFWTRKELLESAIIQSNPYSSLFVNQPINTVIILAILAIYPQHTNYTTRATALFAITRTLACYF